MRTGSFTRLILTIILTLALAHLCLPAEGFVLSKLSRGDFNNLPVKLENAGCVVQSLGGEWQYQLEERESGSGWIPCSFTGTHHVVEFKRHITLPDSFSEFDWEILVPEYRYRVDVSVNDNLLLAGRGDFASLRVPIRPEYLLYGSDNEITLSVQNDLDRFSSVPFQPGLFQPADYAGIFSDVYLVGRQRSTLSGFSFIYECGSDSVDASPRVALRIKPQVMRNRIPHGDTTSALMDNSEILINAVLLDSQRTVAASASISLADFYLSSHSHPLQMPTFSPIFWRPDEPYAYDLELFLVHHKDTLSSWTEKAAFSERTSVNREFTEENTGFVLKAIDYILQDPSGLPVFESMILSDLQSIKELGFNAVRVRGSLPTESFLAATDSLGIRVIADIGLESIPRQFIDDDYLAQIRSGPLMQIIRYSRSHPSLIAICTGSLLEFSDSKVASVVNQLTSDLKTLTPLLCFVESSSEVPNGVDADFIMISKNPYSISIPDHNATNTLPIVYSNLGLLSAYSTDADSNRVATQLSALNYQISQTFEDDNSIGFTIHSFADYYGASPLIIRRGERLNNRYSFGLFTASRRSKHSNDDIAELLRKGDHAPTIKRPQQESSNPILFPSFALVAILILSISMRGNNVLRQNLRRVFRHSHGFFSDIRYRRYLPTSHTMLLWIMNSAAVTGIIVSIAYWLRDSIRLDYFLSFIGLSSNTKVFVATLLWSPAQAISVVFAFVLFSKLLHVLYLKLISNLFRPRVSLGQIWKYTNWAFAPLLFLLPLCAILYRLLDYESLVIPSLVICGLGFLWCLIRLISALQNGFQSSFFRVSLLFILLSGIILSSFYFMIDHWLYFPKYWQWLMSIYPLA